jgi:hypothetical protein
MAPKVLCSCKCGRMVSRETERRHRRKAAPLLLQAVAAAKGKGPLAPLLSSDLRSNPNLSVRPRVSPFPLTNNQPEASLLHSANKSTLPSHEYMLMDNPMNDGASEEAIRIMEESTTECAQRNPGPVSVDEIPSNIDDTLRLAHAALQDRVWAG